MNEMDINKNNSKNLLVVDDDERIRTLLKEYLVNEGFIIYWEISKSSNKHLIFKKRLTTIRALNKFKKLLEEGWTKTNFLDQAA